MSTYTKGTTPITVSRGRPWSLPMRWRDPDGTAINVTGFTITAALRWRGGEVAATVASRNNSAGTWSLSLTADQLAVLPEGQVSRLDVSITDTLGAVHDIEMPVLGVVP